MAFPRATEIAHLLVRQRLHPGDHAVDATVGNGHDTLFLFSCVGPTGRIDGFEIQESALLSAKERLDECPGVFLHHLGHERMGSVVTPGVKAVMFNLGYFPSGDKTLITKPETTLAALAASLEILAINGVATIVIYPGHPGGREEADEVEKWIRGLHRDHFRAVHYGPHGAGERSPSPYLIAIERWA